MPVQQIDAATAKQWLTNNEAILIDVREPAEYASMNVIGAELHPLGSIGCGDLPCTDKKILIHCQSGMRGNSACQKLVSEDDSLTVYNIEGGISALKDAGLPVESSGRNVLPLDRQVQLTIGSSVLAFSLLGYFVDPSFALGAAFFGAGLTNAGLTGWCGLGKVMAKMPWNQ